LKEGKNRLFSPFLSLTFALPITYIYSSYHLHLLFLSLTFAIPITYICYSYHLQRQSLSCRKAIFIVQEGDLSHQEGRIRDNFKCQGKKRYLFRPPSAVVSHPAVSFHKAPIHLACPHFCPRAAGDYANLATSTGRRAAKL